MDVLARAQPVIDTFREQLPNLKEAFDKILEVIRDVWAKVTDTGLLSSFFSRITQFLAGAVSSAQSSIASGTESSASGEQSQDQSQLAAGEAAPLLSSVVEHASTLADSVAPPAEV